ncbi:MAG: type II toxin-antitoxin system RelE/ParE family toxin [Planctomycetaceae bacterium]
MSWPVVINPLAEQDLSDAWDWYDAQRDGLGDEFLECVEEALDGLRTMPQMYGKVFQELRRAHVRRFPYGVFYRIDDQQVTVVAVYHARRDPGAWQQRAEL